MKEARLTWLLPGLLVAGCAQNPPAPTDRIAVADQAVTRAEQSRADQLAPAELALARRKLQEARDHIANRDRAHYEEARRLAEQAAVDARLAEAQANARRAADIERNVRSGAGSVGTEESYAPVP